MGQDVLLKINTYTTFVVTWNIFHFHISSTTFSTQTQKKKTKEPAHWLHEIAIFKRVCHHFQPRLIPHYILISLPFLTVESTPSIGNIFNKKTSFDFSSVFLPQPCLPFNLFMKHVHVLKKTFKICMVLVEDYFMVQDCMITV